jgi:hypothetical protein
MRGEFRGGRGIGIGDVRQPAPATAHDIFSVNLADSSGAD